MNKRLVVFFLMAGIALSTYAQWQPVKSLKGTAGPVVLGNGSDIIVKEWGVYPAPYYYSTDNGNTWIFHSDSYQTVPYIWNGNVIYADSAGNVLIKYGFNAPAVLLSSYFMNQGLVPYYFGYSNSRFFAWVPNDSTARLYYSEDTCVTWNLITQIWSANEFEAGNFVQANNGLVFAANDSTIFRSLDNGNTWDSIPMPGVTGWMVARDSVVAFINNRNYPVTYSTNAGNTWHGVDSQFNNNLICPLAIGDSGIYAAYVLPRYGLYCINPYTGAIADIDLTMMNDPDISSVTYNRGKILIGSSLSGVYEYTESTKTLRALGSALNEVAVWNLNISNRQLLLNTVGDDATRFLGHRNELMYSADNSTTFNVIWTNYSYIYCPLLVDTQALFFGSRYLSNDSDYYQPYLWLYKMTGGQPTAIYTDTDFTGPQWMFWAGAKLFVYDWIKAGIFVSGDTGVSWREVDTLNRAETYATYNDSVYFVTNGLLTVYDNNGSRAYTIAVAGLDGDCRALLVNDTSFVFTNGPVIYQLQKNTGAVNIMASPVDMDSSKVVSMVTTRGYLIASTINGGVFELSPATHHWLAFNQGLDGCSIGSIYVGDSVIYAVLEPAWLWVRNSTDLENVTGIEEPSTAESISVYPNPSSTRLKVSTGSLQTGTLTVYDLTGKIMLQGAMVNASATIDVAGFAAGVFFVRVCGADKNVTGKFVVSK